MMTLMFRLRVMITVQLRNWIFACKYNRLALRKVTSSFEEVLYLVRINDGIHFLV